MSKNERLVNAFQYLKKKGVFKTQKEAALIMECSRQNMSSALKGEENVLTNSFLIRFASAFPQISLGWLLTGEGTMLKPEPKDFHDSVAELPPHGYLSSDKIASNVIPAQTSEPSEYTTTKSGMKYFQRKDGSLLMQVPIIPQNALGSLPDEYEGDTFNEGYEPMFFDVDGVHHGRYYAFRISGNSMDDGTRGSFEDGDTVLVRELPKDEWMPNLHIKKWKFWVVVFNGNVRLKQIVSQDEDKGTITLHSLNKSPEYTDFTLQLDDIERLFNVVQHIPHAIKF